MLRVGVRALEERSRAARINRSVAALTARRSSFLVVASSFLVISVPKMMREDGK
jgi:hypothetical protein